MKSTAVLHGVPIPAFPLLGTIGLTCCVGAGTFAGSDGSRQPTELELRVARKQGEIFANYIKKTHSQ